MVRTKKSNLAPTKKLICREKRIGSPAKTNLTGKKNWRPNIHKLIWQEQSIGAQPVIGVPRWSYGGTDGGTERERRRHELMR